MARAAEARAWWADVEDVRERIERRRASEDRSYRERRAEAGELPSAAAPGPRRRGVREIHPGQRLMLVETAAPPARESRRVRPRPRITTAIGPRPDRIAAWAVILGFMLVAVALLSAHG
jgi:hypothetical protein